MSTDAWGIDDGWEDTSGDWHRAPADTVAALRAAMGADPDDPHGESQPPPGRRLEIVRPGGRDRLESRYDLILEGGEQAGELERLPGDIPLGIHELVPLDGSAPVNLLVSPGRCHLPADLRTWGVAMQVPTTRSRESWGIGDLADVRSVAAWVRRQGGGALALSPLHATTTVGHIEPSPYFPSSRRWRSPLLLRVDEVPGASASATVAQLGARARRLLAEPVVDRDRCWALQREALEHLWQRRGPSVDAALARWRAEQGEPLEHWAAYSALAEHHGARWSSWPSGLRRPDSPEVRAAAHELADRVAFHAWLQQLLAEQLARANVDGVRLVQDLAIGVDPDGADAWSLQDLLATGVTVGAPPDDFAREGQSWGLPPFVPWRLRNAGYRPLADLLAAAMPAGGGLRVDHVMGLSRLFWIPEGAQPVDGTYVRFTSRELLEVLAMVSARAEAVVVGEDLGTVEPGFRQALRSTSVLSTRLVLFEEAPPERYPVESLAMVTTHDLPTIAGLWNGTDEAELAALGRPAPPDATRGLRQRLATVAAAGPDASAADVAARVHRRLGEAPSAVVLATLEDLCGAELRPNVPGTTGQDRPNWSRSLPRTVEELSDPSVVKSTRPLTDGRSGD